MADGFVDLQPELGAVEDQVELALRALIGGVQRHGLFGDARRVLQQAQLVDQLVAFQLVLAAEGVRVRALLDFVVLVAEGREAGAGEVAGLVDDAAEGRDENLAAALEMHRAFGQGDGRIAAQLRVDGEQGGELPVDGDGERVDVAWARPRSPHDASSGARTISCLRAAVPERAIS